ncbi:nucleoside-diphosphate kinase [Sphingomonas sinipercae]|uniref:Nucleoside-diphosphate kinase n=2 Tax=Sphingomonas sinipercae TaxID=2714944 RepID=A0A6G7ZR41_9SPHN|nr:GreA/GreB family elongation factor [Sphingomonas sinipercae]QIL03403.1 nucleoside-diphosphate kinase [Sphingomonas sinipercae]
MSVAFRRDSDEEHLEPKFELPVPPGPNLVTQRGYDLLAAKTQELEAAVAAAGEETRGALQRELRYWRKRLASAQVAHAPTGDTVAFGARVSIEQHGAVRTLTIVGHDEAEPAAGLIGFASPLARALIGAEVDDEVALPGNSGPARVVAVEAP